MLAVAMLMLLPPSFAAAAAGAGAVMLALPPGAAVTAEARRGETRVGPRGEEEAGVLSSCLSGATSAVAAALRLPGDGAFLAACSTAICCLCGVPLWACGRGVVVPRKCLLLWPAWSNC